MAYYSSVASASDSEWTARSEQDLQKQMTLVKGQLRELRVSNETTQAKLLDHGQRQGASV